MLQHSELSAVYFFSGPLLESDETHLAHGVSFANNRQPAFGVWLVEVVAEHAEFHAQFNFVENFF